jgi:phage tail sheath gpL-like
VAPWHSNNGAGGYGSDVAISATDNQIGELLDGINTQALPVNSKEKQAVFGLVEDNAAAIGVAGDAQVNTVRGSFFWQENNDWTPGMLAAHNCAVMRSGYIAHPARNRAGYYHSDSTPYKVPPPFVATDVPTATEVRTALNNGVSVISFSDNDNPGIVRAITSQHLNAGGAFDYKAREHHVTYAIDFVWAEIKSRWNAQKQEFVADDPADGALPTLNTTTPRDLRGLIFAVIDTMTSSKPLGIYDGPILAPDQIEHMKNSVVVTKIPAGLNVVAEFICVQHLLKFEGKFLEVGEAY